MEISRTMAIKNSSDTYTYNWLFGENNFGGLLAFNDLFDRPCASEKLHFKDGILASKSHCMKIFIGKNGDIYLRICVEKGSTPLKNNDEFTHCRIYEIKPFIVTHEKNSKTSVYDFVLLQNDAQPNEDEKAANRLLQMDDFVCKENECLYTFRVGYLCRSIEDRARYYCGNSYPVKWSSSSRGVKEATSFSIEIVISHFYWNDNKLLFPTNEATSLLENKGFLDTKPLYQSNKFSDFTIQCGTREFPVHKIIIENKSSVFQTMFQQPLKEMETGRLIMDDTEPEIVEEFLRFLYTGEITKMEENAAGLLLIADKYAVEDLKLISEIALIKSVNDKNFLELYQFGTLVNSDRLINCCFQQFKRLKKDILKSTTDVERLSKECPGLLLMLAMENN